MEKGGDMPPFWIRTSTTLHRPRHRRSSSPLLSSLFLITTLLLFFVIPSCLSFATQAFRVNLVKKNWSEFKLVIFLISILLLLIQHRRNDDNSSNTDEDNSSWLSFKDGQQFFDGIEENTYRSASEYAPRRQGRQLDEEDLEFKTVTVDTFVLFDTESSSSPPPPPSIPAPPPCSPLRQRMMIAAGRPPTKISILDDGDENLTRVDQSSLIPISVPSVLRPPFEYTVCDYVRNSQSSRSSSVDFDNYVDIFPIEESIIATSTIEGGDVSRDINKKADIFIAQTKAGWRLEKNSSIKERQEMGIAAPC